MTETVEPQLAKEQIHSGEEIAFIDVREAGQFGEGHAFLASSAPYSRLEATLPSMVPNLAVPIILIDDADGIAERAADRLEGLGYQNVKVFAGGMPAWAAAGFVVFKGVNVPSKTLGELAEVENHPNMLTPETLMEWQQSGKRFALFDVRTPTEHARMRVPGAVCMPIGELVHRFDDAVQEPDLPVVVACAGRTRGLIASSALHFAHVPNPVYALENGTQGWALAGFNLQRGAKADPLPGLSEKGRAGSEERARSLSADWSIPMIDGAAFAKLLQDKSRTLYVIDVRSPEEFAAGHMDGAIHMPAGQLVHLTDQLVGVRHSRIVLCDDTGARAALAGIWLKQLGYEPYVFSGNGAEIAQVNAPSRSLPPMEPPPAVAPDNVAQALDSGTGILLDLRSSRAFRAGHARGAVWATRPRLTEVLAKHHGPVYLMADDLIVAALAALDLIEAGVEEIGVVKGGFDAWRAAGLPVEISPNSPSDAEAIDFLLFVHDRHDGNRESSERYLAWEQGLIGQLDPQEKSGFRLSPSA